MPEDAFAHPRTAATYTKFLIEYVRDRKAESLLDAVARCSYRPATILEKSVPQMKRKGRIQKGMDADIIVFNMDDLKVRSTYTNPNHHSLGMKHVLVNGLPIISDGTLDTKAFLVNRSEGLLNNLNSATGCNNRDVFCEFGYDT